MHYQNQTHIPQGHTHAKVRDGSTAYVKLQQELQHPVAQLCGPRGRRDPRRAPPPTGHYAVQPQARTCYLPYSPRYALRPDNSELLLKLGVRFMFKFQSPCNTLVDGCHSSPVGSQPRFSSFLCG